MNKSIIVFFVIVLTPLIVCSLPFLTIYFIIDRFFTYKENIKGIEKKKLINDYTVNDWANDNIKHK